MVQMLGTIVSYGPKTSDVNSVLHETQKGRTMNRTHFVQATLHAPWFFGSLPGP